MADPNDQKRNPDETRDQRHPQAIDRQQNQQNRQQDGDRTAIKGEDESSVENSGGGENIDQNDVPLGK